jgi:signal-transduction protein with cAMP-binding, CBS, and nucleotidyltransferase domain
MDLRESLEEPVSRYMSKGYAQVEEEESVHRAAVAMQKVDATEALVMKGRSPVGIITERDILYKVVAKGLAPQQVKSKDVMSSPLQTIEDSAKVADAIAKMSSLGLRRLVVTRKGEPMGMVTQKAMVSGQGQVPLPELAPPHGFSCPYCDAILKSREELSKHIDQVHVGLGLLGGDRTKW